MVPEDGVETCRCSCTSCVLYQNVCLLDNMLAVRTCTVWVRRCLKKSRMCVFLNTLHKSCWLPLTLALTFPGLAGEDGGSGVRRTDRRAGCDLHACVPPVRVPLWKRPLCASQPLLWCCEWLWRLFRWTPLVHA